MMKHNTFFKMIMAGCLFFSTVSCWQDTKVVDSGVVDSNKVIDEDTSVSVIWNYDAYGDSMIFVGNSDQELSTERVLTMLNNKYADLISMNLERESGDTVFVQIADATYLTQSMGTTGTFGYLAEVTYSFTELPSVQFVYFNFEEGDHASPGLYQRNDFNNKLKI